MSFAAPYFLFALLAGLVPLILHLIHRRRAPELSFSTIRLLRQSVQKTRRRKTVEDWLLLLLRSGLLMLLAVGLSGPGSRALGPLLGGRGGIAVAIILDNSGSMSAVAEDRSRFDDARESARLILEGLRPTDSAALLVTSGEPDPTLGAFVQPPATLSQAIGRSHAGYERAELARELVAARRLLARSRAGRKEIYILTDGQRLSWEGLEESGKEEKPESASAAVVVADLGGEGRVDLGLRSPRVKRPAPISGAPIEIEVEVVNLSTVARTGNVELLVDGRREAVSPPLALGPGGSARHGFEFAGGRAGVHRAEMRLTEEDGNPANNRVHAAWTVNPGVRIGIAQAHRHEIATADDAYYLERALVSEGESGAFQVERLSLEELGTRPLEGFSVLFLVNLAKLEAGAAGRVRDFVVGGGHVFWIVGGNVDADTYNSMNEKVDGKLLPAPLVPEREPPVGGAGSWRIGSLDESHPALAPLCEPVTLARSVLVHRQIPFRAPLASESRVLARLDDGEALLLERGVGAGSVLLLGTALRPEWSNLPLRPIFLPLITRLTFALAGADADRSQSTAGVPIELPTRGLADSWEVTRPAGEVLRLKPTQENPRSIRYTDTHEPGTYVARALGGESPRIEPRAINADSEEFDATRIDQNELRRRFGASPFSYCHGKEELRAAIGKLREGTDLSGGFLVAVLIALLVETFVANRRTDLAGRGAVSAPERSERAGEELDPEWLANLEGAASDG